MADNDCIFCKIIRGDVPCAKVHETDTFFSFLDIAPVFKGHALVIPKDHHETIFDLPLDLSEGLLDMVQRVGRAVMEGTGAGGLNIGMNNYRVANQLVPHAHFHLIPRFEGDGLEFWPQQQYASQDEMASFAERIRARLG